MEWEIDYRIVNIAPRGKVLSEPSSETAQWPTVVLRAPEEDVAVESGERVVSANAANAASVAAAMSATRNPDVFMFKLDLLFVDDNGYSLQTSIFTGPSNPESSSLSCFDQCFQLVHVVRSTSGSMSSPMSRFGQRLVTRTSMSNTTGFCAHFGAVQLLACVCSGKLYADARLSLRHNGIVESGYVHAFFLHRTRTIR